MKKIKIAQIGLGPHTHSIQVFESLKKQTELFDFVGFAVPEEEKETARIRRTKFADSICEVPELTVEAILNDPEIEAVAIEGDELNLTKYALMAAEKGKQIHMEKPGGADLGAFERLIGEVKARNLVFHTGYMYRYNPYVRELIQRVRNGELGEIFGVEAHMSCRHDVETRQWLTTLPGGMMFYLGCHLVDLVLQLQGVPKNIVVFNRPTGMDGVREACDFGMAVFEYPNGCSVVKTCGEEIGGYARRSLLVTGSKGSIELRPLEAAADEGKIYTEKTEYWSEGFVAGGESARCEPFGRYDVMMEGFARIVRGEIENPYTYEYELELYRYILKACGQ